MNILILLLSLTAYPACLDDNPIYPCTVGFFANPIRVIMPGDIDRYCQIVYINKEDSRIECEDDKELNIRGN